MDIVVVCVFVAIMNITMYVLGYHQGWLKGWEHHIEAGSWRDDSILHLQEINHRFAKAYAKLKEETSCQYDDDEDSD